MVATVYRSKKGEEVRGLNIEVRVTLEWSIKTIGGRLTSMNIFQNLP